MNKKGFTLLEVIISLLIISVISVLLVYLTNRQNKIMDKSFYTYQAYTYMSNTKEIIKGDTFFYLHPELYYNDPNNLIKTTSSTNYYTININFDRLGNVCNESNSIFKLIIVCNIYNNSNYKIYNYQLRASKSFDYSSGSYFGGGMFIAKCE